MSKYLKAQNLNRRVKFQRKTGERDDWKEPLDDWVDVCERWADVNMLNGMGAISLEFRTDGTEVSRVPGSVRIRRTLGLTADMRMVFEGRNYDIRAILPDTQDNRYTDVVVALGANDGG